MKPEPMMDLAETAKWIGIHPDTLRANAAGYGGLRGPGSRSPWRFVASRTIAAMSQPMPTSTDIKTPTVGRRSAAGDREGAPLLEIKGPPSEPPSAGRRLEEP
ncbi:MAG: hypothetical protein JSU06_19685 [Actinobacteria bacterium]|nr:hypothetical protein [Actinomycetota bacterium]